MSHLSLAELNRKLAAAARKGYGGSQIQPLQTSRTAVRGDPGLVVLESNDEVAIAYSVEEGDERVTFVRPLKLA